MAVVSLHMHAAREKTLLCNAVTAVLMPHSPVQVGRAAAAVALAPFLDRGSKLIQHKLHLQSQAAALWVVVGCCLATSVVLFGSTVLAWA